MPEQRYIPARPRTEEEIADLPDCPSILDNAEQRGITQVVHFTTVRGAVGVIAAKALKSRARVGEDEYLERVYQPNALFRKDHAWLDYVNLSIERINEWMFQTSTRWHASENNPWVVLSFQPRMLSHPGVVFTTTNNIYPSCERAEGLSGFRRMFAGTVRGYYGQERNREGKLDSWPTDRQAEVLYPGEVSWANLQRIDVQLEQSLETIHGAMGALGASVPIRHAPEVFE